MRPQNIGKYPNCTKLKFNHNIRDMSNTKDRVFDRISKTEKKRIVSQNIF